MWATPTQVQVVLVGHVGYAHASRVWVMWAMRCQVQVWAMWATPTEVQISFVGHVGYAYASPSAASVKTCADHLWVMWAMFPGNLSRTGSLAFLYFRVVY